MQPKPYGLTAKRQVKEEPKHLMNLLICTCIILPGGLYIICYNLVFVFWVSRATSPECRLLVESSAVSSPPVEANTYYHTLFFNTLYHSLPYICIVQYEYHSYIHNSFQYTIHVQLYMLSLLPRQTGGGSDKGKSTQSTCFRNFYVGKQTNKGSNKIGKANYNLYQTYM